ncbi:MAG: FHA domain-containing protein [Phycisphaeraceae bacterium]
MLKLRLLTGPRAGRQLRVSDTKPVSVGRRVGRLRLHDSRVSKRHAKIFFAGGVWVLRDLGSANGTYVNRRKCDGLVELETGDVVQMGRVLIKVLQADAVGMDPTRTVPSTRGTQASGLGIDAFTASGATGELPAIDPAPLDDGKPDTDGEVDLASIFGEDNDDDDLIDFSDQSRADASHSGTIAAGKTQASNETIELEPIDDEQHTPDSAQDTAEDRPEVEDPLLAGLGEQDDTPSAAGDLIDLDDESQDPPKPGTTILAALDDANDDDDSPAVVGLRLDQAAPQQPPVAEEHKDDAPRAAERTTDASTDGEPIDIEPVDGVGPKAEPLSVEASADDALEASVQPLPDLDDEDPQAEAPTGTVESDADDHAEDETSGVALDAQDKAVDAEVRDEPQTDSGPAPASILPVDAERAADASLTETPSADTQADTALDLETAHAEIAFDDIAESGPIPVDPDILMQELWPVDEPQVVAETPTQADPEAAEAGLQAKDTGAKQAQSSAEDDDNTPADDLALDASAGVVGDAEPRADAGFDVDVDPADDPLPDAIVEAEPSQAESSQADAPKVEASGEPVSTEFDIDAAFDALSEGLDDSLSLPAINDADESQAADTSRDPDAPTTDPDADGLEWSSADSSFGFDAEDASVQDESGTAFHDAPRAEPQDEPVQASTDTDRDDDDDAPPPPGTGATDEDAFAGSQLDIGFIREALAKLEADEHAEDASAGGVQAESETIERAAEPVTADHDQPREQAIGVASAVENASAPQPILAPPGLNPTSVLPPSEPGRSYRPAEQRKFRWLFTALSMLVVFALGAVLAVIIVNQGKPIAGRPDASDAAKPDTNPKPPEVGTNPGGADPPAPDGTRPPTGPQLPDNPYTDPPFDPGADPVAPRDLPTPIAGAAPVPEPFAQGPSVLGSRAVAGITVTSGGEPVELTKPDRPTRPGVVIEPNLPGTNPPILPPTDPLPPPDPKPGPDTPTDAGSDTPTDATAPDTTAPDTPAPDIAPPALPADSKARIVFLVDASGSLVDSLPQMLVWLGEALDTVGDDERFAVIFFKANKAIETDPAGLQQPTRDVLNKLDQNWLDPAAAPLLPTGRSDPSVALAKALSYDPTDIYLLSDESFARFAGDTTRDQAVKLVTDALGQADVKLHGVQFFYRDEGGVLETLANQYGGTFEFVKEDVVPEGDPIDLLEELDKNE